MEQRTEEWYQARLGKVTASKVYDVMKKTKSGYSTSRKNYLAQLLCERLTGAKEEGFTSAAMQRGIDLEIMARTAYEVETGRIVKDAGFVTHFQYEQFGASPDGFADDGLIEIKCPNTMTHIDFLQTGKIKPEYEWQMRAQMVCTSRNWCDFVSFDDRLPDNLQIKIVRVDRCEKKEAEMMLEIDSFLAELDKLEKDLRGLQCN